MIRKSSMATIFPFPTPNIVSLSKKRMFDLGFFKKSTRFFNNVWEMLGFMELHKLSFHRFCRIFLHFDIFLSHNNKSVIYNISWGTPINKSQKGICRTVHGYVTLVIFNMSVVILFSDSYINMIWFCSLLNT